MSFDQLRVVFLENLVLPLFLFNDLQPFEFLGRPTFSPAIALSTSVVLGTIGMLAGYFPARRASSARRCVSE